MTGGIEMGNKTRFITRETDVNKTSRRWTREDETDREDSHAWAVGEQDWGDVETSQVLEEVAVRRQSKLGLARKDGQLEPKE